MGSLIQPGRTPLLPIRQKLQLYQELHDIDRATIDPEFLDDFRTLKLELENYRSKLPICSKLLYRIQTYINETGDTRQEIHGNYETIKVLTEPSGQFAGWKMSG